MSGYGSLESLMFACLLPLGVMSASGCCSCSASCECTCCNSTCCCECCSDYKVPLAGTLGVFIPLIVEAVLLAVVIGLIIWKRIAVAKFLYNLQVPKMRDIPQLVIQKFRPSSSTPPPEVYVERTVQNPTYDIEEGQPSDKSDEAKEPTELYEEIPPEEGTSNLEEYEDNGVYDVPEALENDQLEAYATTDIPGEEMYETAYATTDVSGEDMLQAYATTDVSVGGDMLKAYAITDVSQNEKLCKAYAVTDVPEGRSGSGSQQKVVSAEVHADRSNVNGSKMRADTGGQTTPQKNIDTATRVKNVGVQLPSLTAQSKDASNKAGVKAANTLPTKQQKEGSKMTNKASLRGKPTTAMKPALHPKPAGTKDKTGTAETSKRVKFEDEERRRSKSYTGTHWESVTPEEQGSKSSTKSSTKGKPKPLPKKRGLNLMRNRGSSDSGVEGYSKLDLKSQYASLEPHMKQETNAKDAIDTKVMQDSYSHLKH